MITNCPFCGAESPVDARECQVCGVIVRTISQRMAAQTRDTVPNVPAPLTGTKITLPYPTNYKVIDDDAVTEREVIKTIADLDAEAALEDDLAITLPDATPLKKKKP